jgi:predicted SprT family Zn-dependent metalloprotease
VISLSRLYCLKARDDQVRDTILHEIAHALAGPKHNHDARWKSIARSIGCTADRCHTVDFAPARYIASCSRCGWHQKKNRRLRGGVCRTCREPVEYRQFTEQAWEELTQRQASEPSAPRAS